MKSKGKPRNPFVALAKFRKAGSHAKPVKSLRRQEKQALTKAAKQSPESWHKRSQLKYACAMTPATVWLPWTELVSHAGAMISLAWYESPLCGTLPPP